MPESLFVIYSRRDDVEIRLLDYKLREFGHRLWLDSAELRPDQDWSNAIRQAIQAASAVLICLSPEWIYDVEFVQAELQTILSSMRVIDKPLPLIAVRLQQCKIPRRLRFDWIDMFESDGIQRLNDVIANLDATKTQEQLKTLLDFAGEFENEASQNKLQLHLRQHWDESITLWGERQFERLLAIWEPFESHPYFRVDSEEWADDDRSRCKLHSIKCLLFKSHAQLGQSDDFETHVPAAFATLREVVTVPAWSTGVGADNLNAIEAETQNWNYRLTLRFAERWFLGWGESVTTMFDIPECDSLSLENQVHTRIKELDAVLEQNGA